MLSLEYWDQNSGFSLCSFSAFSISEDGRETSLNVNCSCFRWCFGVIVFLVTENSICIKAVRMTDVCPSSDFISYQMKATVLLHTVLCACECAEVPYCTGSPKQRFTCKQLPLTKKNLNATAIPLSNPFRSAIPCGDALPVYMCLEYCCPNSCKGAGRHTLRF